MGDEWINIVNNTFLTKKTPSLNYKVSVGSDLKEKYDVLISNFVADILIDSSGAKSNGIVDYEDLIGEEIDAILVDESVASDLTSNNKDCKLIDDISSLSSPFAIAVNKDDKELLIQINKILKEIKDNGELDKLKKKWNLL